MGYVYKQRSEASYEAQLHDGKLTTVKEGVNSFKPREGKNIIRILPPTWEAPLHFGLTIYAHYKMGINNKSSFLCLKNEIPGRNAEPCPLCDKANLFNNDYETKKQYLPNKRVAVYVVDRMNEARGVQLWMMPISLNKEICMRSKDQFTGERYNVDSPEGTGSQTGGGHDILFEYVPKTAKGFPDYLNLTINPNSTPLEVGNSKHLNYALENPLPTVLVFSSFDNLKNIAEITGAVTPQVAGHNPNTIDAVFPMEPPVTSAAVTTEYPPQNDQLSKLEQLKAAYKNK